MTTNKKFVPIHPETLKWARMDAGLTIDQIAGQLNMPPEQLQQFEQGKQGITLSQAKRLAGKYKVSLPFLYLKTPPKKHPFLDLIDFRSQDHKKDYSDRLCLAIKIAARRQDWLGDFLKAEGHKKLNWLGKFANERDSKKIAKHIKQWLAIDRQTIAEFKNNQDALAYWVDKIEAKGVMVGVNDNQRFSQIPSSEYSGLVLYDDYAPLILVNPKDSISRRIFTLLHELAHLLTQKESSLSIIDFRMETSQYDPVEVLCNRVASDLLIDEKTLKEKWVSLKTEKDNIECLAKWFKTSLSCIAVKLKLLKMIDQKKLDELLQYYQKQYQDSQKKKGGGYARPAPEKQTINRCGKLLTKQVLKAYEQGSINAIEIYDVLGIKLKYLDKLSQRLGFKLHRWIA